MTDLTTLADSLEAGAVEMQRELLGDAWDALGPVQKWTGEQAGRFGKLLDAGAYVDAAMMLVPEGWSIGVGDLRGYDPPMWRAHLRDHRPGHLTKEGHSHIWREGNTPASMALAIAAAALRAHSTDGENSRG